MRIANVVLPGWGEKGQTPADEVRLSGATCEIVETAGVLPRTPVSDFELEMADLLHLEAGLRAVEAGCDAVFINSVLDYGVRLLRAETPVPVVGAGEAAIAVSALVAKTFAIVTVWPEITRSSYEHLLARNNASDRCVSIRHVTKRVKDIEELGGGAALKEMILAQSNDIVGRIVAECRSAVEADGAEVVILGCTCMAPSVALVQAALTCPVIDPMTAGYRAAESAAALKLRRRPLIVAPDGRMLSSARVAAMLSAFGSFEVPADSPCPVCVP